MVKRGMVEILEMVEMDNQIKGVLGPNGMIVPPKEASSDEGVQKHVRFQPDIWDGLEKVMGRSERSLNDVLNRLLRWAIQEDAREHQMVEPAEPAHPVKKKKREV